ncbi:MAG: prepilin peptidase [Firmicutes bacterium HGW-Firmicutes-15]|nr:MAG: prepilin peptidase [Firmicutes bacterium HGW-Firmicutes-15]
MVNIIVIIFALLIGSFLNVVIYRIPRKESVLWPGSHCPACEQGLKIGDLMPVISYVWLGGRCRYCRDRISPRYLLVEILTVITFLLVFLKWGISVETGTGWIFTAILTITAFTDLDEGIIPDLITCPGIVIGLLLSPYMIGIKSSALGAIIFSGICISIAILSHGGMGGGDIKLAGFIGTFTGYGGSMITLIIASVAGGIWAAILLWQGKAHRKTAIKFGPFLSVAAWLVWMYEIEILISIFGYSLYTY